MGRIWLNLIDQWILMEIHLLFSQLKKIYEEIVTAHNFNSLSYFDDGVPKPSLNIVSITTGLAPLGACMSAKSFQLCPALCDPTDCNLPGSVVCGILQARIPGWVALRSAGGSFQSKDETLVSLSPGLAGGFFTTGATWEALPGKL